MKLQNYSFHSAHKDRADAAQLVSGVDELLANFPPLPLAASGDESAGAAAAHRRQPYSEGSAVKA